MIYLICNVMYIEFLQDDIDDVLDIFSLQIAESTGDIVHVGVGRKDDIGLQGCGVTHQAARVGVTDHIKKLAINDLIK